MLSLYLGLTCLLHRLESLLKVKVCHLMYAANSQCSWAALGIWDYINETDMQCENGLLSVCVCAAPPMVPLAPWQLKPEYLQRLAPQGALFCIIIKDAYGVWETVMLHTRSKKKRKLAYTVWRDCNVLQLFCARICWISGYFIALIFSSSFFLSHREAPERLGWDGARDSGITAFCSTSHFPRKQPSVV